jgi:hypothetical protein
MILLALAAVSAVMFALPAVASAGTWELDGFGKFTSAAGVTTLTQDPLNAEDKPTEVTCKSSTGTGTYTSKTGGNEFTQTFKECTESLFGFSCTTAGQAAGTIKTTDLTFENIMIDSTAQKAGGTPGILITPNAGHFASFTCGGFIPVSVNGNGLIGDLTQPCGDVKAAGVARELNFDSVATGTQRYMQVTTAGTKFDLSSTSSGTTRTASQDGEGKVTFAGAATTITCP